MKSLNPKAHRAHLAFLICLGFASVSPANLLAQTAPKADAAKTTDGEVVVLSPFVVTSEDDTGYRATNSISGTRLNTPIKDTPMPIEVITRQFLDDTGATDLRSALKYSSGIILTSQNDLSNFGGNVYQGPGGVNNPEGVTANPNAVQIKLRGFVTDNALRDGFIRQNSTDSVNIDRVEVVRGPAALFYGIGNFGGVVNYLVKRPSEHRTSGYDFTYGTYNLMRGQFDVSGPVSKDKKLTYRVSGALQAAEDSTDYFKQNHYFVSPVVLWRPTSKTEVYFDAEYGAQHIGGMGARRLRSVANVGINSDRNEHGALFTPPGADPETFRVTGPDTYLNSQASNTLLKVTQELYKRVHLLVGYNYSTSNMQTRDVQAQLFTNVGPAALRQTIFLNVLDPDRGTSGNQYGEIPGSIIQYNWTRADEENTGKQFRAEITAGVELFSSASKWLRFDNQVLVGYSDINRVLDSNSGATFGGYNYRAPLDVRPLQFGTQGDGTADLGIHKNSFATNESTDEAFYASYQGKFLDNRLLVLMGVRRDILDTANNSIGIISPGATPVVSANRADTQKEQTYQKGLSFQITKAVSIYALQSEGLQPNFSGKLLPDTGAPAGASIAKSKEIGLKFDLFNGRISGTISRFKITKTGFVGAPWFSPVTLGKPRFDPTKDIVFNVSNFTPTSAGSGGSNGGVPYKATGLPTLDQPAVVAAWNNAVATGAAFRDGSGAWHVNATKPAGTAYMDTAFATIDGDFGAAWPGFLYIGLDGSDPLVNNATMDTMAFHGSGSTNATLLLTDESKGYDAQVLIKASDNLQFVVNGAVTEVQRVNFGQWMAYPHLQDRWPVWNFHNASWGTFGLPRSQIYGTPSTATSGPKTETRTSAGQAAGDDTPKYRFDIWANYRFEGSLDGLSVGLGGYWESKRQYFSGVTHGAGQNVFDDKGELLVLYTQPRYNVDAMVRYDWKGERRGKHYVQLNIANVLNDKDQYGLIYSAPISAKLTYGVRF